MSRRVVSLDCPFDGFWRIRRTTDTNGVVLLTSNGGRIPIDTDWLAIPDSWGVLHVKVVTPNAEFDFAVEPGAPEATENSSVAQGDLPTVKARGLHQQNAPKHLLTCVALCKPTLLDPHEDRVPSATEMLDTLVEAGVDPVSRKPTRVQRRLEEVAGWLTVQPRTNRALRDRLIASRAVTLDHLALLSPQQRQRERDGIAP